MLYATNIKTYMLVVSTNLLKKNAIKKKMKNAKVP